ncbi:alpha/beta fold hydrolase [Roseisalinus antarcticus]|uniref:Transcriptional activator CadC n=1 Tax=Roseisalinus antarcticus TaxID=254357 RepID=A0A1Y5STH4_9RHOB|nr:alpha/beta fold hydrolase [Roseisalinus antarcticus]SLN47950.1 Transcriptional activator CadC [Roseisalinus antarcticus]
MIYRFADCVLDTETHAFRRAGEAVHLEPQVFELIRLLAMADGGLVARDRIVEAVWGGRVVSEATISSRINAARRATGDSGRAQRIIRTVTRLGLQLAVPVTCDGAAPSAAPLPQATPAPPETGPVRLVAAADGTSIAWSASGTGPPLLRAGHWLSHLEMDAESPVWGPLLARLGAGRRLIRYDQRGTGLSDRAARRFATEDFAGDMAAVAGAASPDEPVAIFAASQSVAHAVSFAAAHPTRVSRMIFWGGFARGPGERGAGAAAMGAGLAEMIRNGWGRASSPFMKSVASLFMPGATPAQLADFVAIQLASADPETAVALRQSMERVNVTERLAQVRCPVLVAHATDDALHPLEEGRILAAGIPDAEFLALAGDSHVPLPQSAAFGRLMDAVDGFLGRDWGRDWGRD